MCKRGAVIPARQALGLWEGSLPVSKDEFEKVQGILAGGITAEGLDDVVLTE
jgi:hypothetical protein